MDQEKREKNLPGYLSFFSVICDKNTLAKQFKGERVCFGSQFKGRAHHGREVKAAGARMHAAGQLPFSTTQSRISTKECCHLQWESLPTSNNGIKIIRIVMPRSPSYDSRLSSW